jgi:putative spermidine/putrescine transport system ATP-binding protein
MTPTLDEAAPIVDVVDVDRPAPAGAEAGAHRRVAVTLDDVEKRFGDVLAVTGVNLEIGEGEFFSMLGPSGSGKTTTLRLIAGFETLTRGRISLYGRDVSKIPAFERDVNTVFQDYALFPHMNVYENVGYGLMVRHVPAGERTSRVAEALRRVRLAGFEDRRPSQLSGGQRQRVALARALVNRPKVLLLDEPLGALDRKLREEMQVELKEIQRQVGITFVFVTHDQDEALSMSDRVAVFNAGSVEQVGTPAEIYEHPATEFVAGFVGTSNVIEGELARHIVGQLGRFSVRPEKIRLEPPGATAAPDEHSVGGRIRDVVYLGAQTRYLVTVAGDVDIVVATQNLTSAIEGIAQRGREVQLVWNKRNTLSLAASEPEATSRRTGS